jgi:hypothetical protein
MHERVDGGARVLRVLLAMIIVPACVQAAHDEPRPPPAGVAVTSACEEGWQRPAGEWRSTDSEAGFRLWYEADGELDAATAGAIAGAVEARLRSGVDETSATAQRAAERRPLNGRLDVYLVRNPPVPVHIEPALDCAGRRPLVAIDSADSDLPRAIARAWLTTVHLGLPVEDDCEHY